MKKKDERLIPFKTIDYILGILVFFVSFGIYLHTLTPTVGFHDSGELITCAFSLGIAHPPGYPLYTLLGKVFITLIPIGNIAFRMNMQSALFASLCVMMVYFITLKVSGRAEERKNGRIISSVVASLILAFSLTFWEQAVIAEKYTLNAFFATLIIFILLKWEEGLRLKASGSRLLYLFCFILGLSFTHHFQTIYLVPASIFFILATLIKRKLKSQKSKLKTKSFSLPTLYSLLSTPSKMFLLFILPLFLWAYLPLRASQDPVLNWGDPSNWENFIEHITVKSYRSYFSTSIDQVLKNLKNHLIFFPKEFTFYLLPICLIGFIILFLKKKTIFLFFLLIFAVNIFHSIRYTIFNIKDYYIPSYIIFSILTGTGFLTIAKLIPKRYPVLYLFFIFLPILLFETHYFQNNRTKHYFAYDYGMNILRPLEKNAIIFIRGDNVILPLWYLQWVESFRKDVSNIDTTLLQDDWYGEHIKKIYSYLSFPFSPHRIKQATVDVIEAIVKDRILKITISNKSHSCYINYPIEFPTEYSLIQEGFLLRIYEKKKVPEIPKIVEFKHRGFYDKKIFKDERTEIIIKSCEALLKTAYWDFALMYVNKNKYNEAISLYKEVLKINPDFAPVHYNLGCLYQEIGKLGLAIEEYKKAIKIEPQNTKALYNLALIYWSRGEEKKAIYFFNEVLKLAPQDLRARRDLVRIYYNRRLFDKAWIECKYILKISPENLFAKQMLEECKKKIVDKN